MSQSFSYDGLGTSWWVEVFDEVDEKNLQVITHDLEIFSRQFEENYSRFRSNSLISILNRDRTLKNPSLELQNLLTYGKGLYLRTNSVFNILLGHHLEARGYDANYSFTSKIDHSILPLCDPVTDLEISSELITLHCGNIDIGGYGKGYLIDRLVELLRSYNLEYFLINGGGDMYATSNQGEPIEIYLEHPLNLGEFIQKSTLHNQGFAASSPFKRQWKNGLNNFTHIIKEDFSIPELATFVKANSAAEADAFATACLLLNEAQCLSINKTESLEIARFDKTTNQIWQTSNFG